MIQIIKNLFKSSDQPNLKELVAQGATILDVRTSTEFKQGHIKGSINIPVQSLSSQMGRLNKQKPVITCCASGMRSSSAKSILLSEGFAEVHNGGGWSSLEKKLNQ